MPSASLGPWPIEKPMSFCFATKSPNPLHSSMPLITGAPRSEVSHQSLPSYWLDARLTCVKTGKFWLLWPSKAGLPCRRTKHWALVNTSAHWCTWKQVPELQPERPFRPLKSPGWPLWVNSPNLDLPDPLHHPKHWTKNKDIAAVQVHLKILWTGATTSILKPPMRSLPGLTHRPNIFGKGCKAQKLVARPPRPLRECQAVFTVPVQPASVPNPFLPFLPH